VAKLKKINIDLEANKIALHFHDDKEPLTLHFDTPSRRFYFSLIAFIANEMKNQGKPGFVYIRKHEKTLKFLDSSLTGEHASKNVEDLWGKIRKAWRHRLPELETASLFKILDRDLVPPYEKGGKYRYKCSEDESDICANLFDYDESNKWQCKFGIDLVSLGLNDISIIFGDQKDNAAWKEYMKHLGSLGKPNENLKEARIRTIPTRWKLSAYIAAAILIVFGASVIIWNIFLRPVPPPAEIVTELSSDLELSNKPSIAVLPFDNMSGDPGQEYFCDGITEEIITALAKVPRIFVIARNSTFTYKGKPVKVQQVGRELGVRYVLEGSVRMVGNRVRISAQLNDAISGHHLWAERYDRDLKDIFAVQDEITMKIITELQVELTVGEQARLWAKSTDNIDAYLKSLQGHRYYVQHNADDYVRARQMFEEAIELDPEYAAAYASLANVYLYAGSSLGMSFDETEKQAHKLLQKALTIDKTDYKARLQLGIQYHYDRQYEKAIAEYKNFIELYPGFPDGHRQLGLILVKCGKPEEAILHLKKVLRLIPTTKRPPVPLGVAYRDMGRYEEAIQVFKEILLVQPKNVFALVNLASTYAALEREEEARAIVKEVLQWNPYLTIEKLLKGRISYKNPADNERFAELLRKAGLPE